MDDGINVRRVTSKDLLEYMRMRKAQDAPWDVIRWDENPLESGSGSPDCETHLKIVNSHPAWKELLDAQRKVSLSCEVHIIADGGYVPCHRVFLQQKSEFLDMLIAENLKVNMPGGGNVISISLMDVNLDHLKTVVTLLYTGVCVVADYDEENEVKGILRLLQIDIKKFKITREVVESTKKKKKMKCVTTLRFKDDTATEHASHDGASRVPSVPSTNSGSSVAPSTSNSQMPGSSTSNPGVRNIPEITKVARGTFNPKKTTERIQRKPSGSSALKDDNNDNSDGDDPDLPPLPPIQKVAPGALIQMNKQPRIVRPVLKSSRRGRAGSRRGGQRATSTGATAVNPEDEDSNGPKGNYERDDDYIPSSGKEVPVEETDDDVGEEEVMDLDSEIEERRPHTRKSAPKPIEETSSRYTLRKRRQGSSNTADGMEHDAGSAKNNETEHPPLENNLEAPRPARTRGKGISPVNVTGKRGPARSSSANTENEDEILKHVCTFCKVGFREVEGLKFHLENTSCAKHFTGTYDILTKYCNTCRSFFKPYDDCEFMDHIGVCVYSARPSQKGRRSSGANSHNSSNSANKSPAMATLVPQTGSKKGPQTNNKQGTRGAPKKTTDVLGLIQTSIVLDNLNSKQVATMINNIRNKKVPACRPVLDNGHKFVFQAKSDKEKMTAVSVPSTSKKSVMAPPSPPPCPTDSHQFAETPNVSLPSASSSTFDPTAASTPVSPGNLKSADKNKIKRSGKSTRPGPLSAKRKAIAQGDEKEGGRNDEEQAIAVKKSRTNNAGQKENNRPSDATNDNGDNRTIVSNTTEENRIGQDPQVQTTAKQLREKLYKKLHPSSSAQGGLMSEQTSTPVTKDVSKPVAPSQDVLPATKVQTDPKKQHQTTNSQPAKTVAFIPTIQGEKKNEKVTNKASVDNINPKPPVEQSGQKRSEQTTSGGTRSSIFTVGQLANSIVDELMQRTEDTVSTSPVESPVTASTGQPAPPKEPNKQANPPQLSTNAGTGTTSNSQIQSSAQVQPARTGQTTTVSLLNPRMMMPSLPSMTSVIGAPVPSRPRLLSPPPVLQKSSNAQYKQNNSSNVGQLSAASSNAGVPPGQLQKLQSQTNPSAVQPRAEIQQLTSQVSIQSVMSQSVTGSSCFPAQNSRTVSISPEALHGRRISSEFGDLDIRRVESQRLGPRPNSTPIQGQALMPTGGNMRISQQQQMYIQRPTSTPPQFQQHQAPVSLPIDTAAPTIFSQQLTRSNNALLLSSRQGQGQPQPSRPTSALPQTVLQNQMQQQLVERSQSVVPTTQQRQPQYTTHSNMFAPQQMIMHQQQYQQASMSSTATLPQVQGQMGRYIPQSAVQQQPPQPNQQAIVPNSQQIASMMRGATDTFAHVTGYSQPSPNVNANIPTISLVQNVNTTFISPITTVHLPVTRLMNPLASSRSHPTAAQHNHSQHQQQIMMIESNQSATSSTIALNSASASSNVNFNQNNTNQVVAIRNNNNTTVNTGGTYFHSASTHASSAQQTVAITAESAESKPSVVFQGPYGKEVLEERTFNCPDCGLNFETETTFQDHKSNAMCM